MKKLKLSLLSILFSINAGFTCSDAIVTKGASKDGSVMISYLADSHVLYGELYHWAAKNYSEGEMLEIREWDTNKFLGKIPQVSKTFNVVGNMNEYQVAITESTFGGRKELKNNQGIMDYGSLIYVTLQRAKTAREAIEIMTDLVEKHGYYSSGESFSIADKKEAWIMEMIGKGEEKGAVWVARRVPDGYISGHANCARITTFPLNDKKNCVYSKDVISFAKKKGYYSGKDEDFDFSATYDPLKFSNVRFSDARVWDMFRKVNKEIGEKYKHYAMGDLTKERLPLWIKPDYKLTVKDVMELTRGYYEGTPMDMTKDIGAGPHNLPYRWRPLTWKVDDKEYFNERALSTQQTGFSLVAQSRDWLPDTYGGILWFGVDDTYSTCYTPIYSSSTEIPETFAVGNGDLLTYSDNAAFWVFNSVSNRCYLRYDDMINDVKEVQVELEQKHIDDVKNIDEKVSKMKNDKEIISFVSNFSVKTANDMVERWKKLDKYLLVKYIDGNIKKEKDKQFERTEDGYPASPNQPTYKKEWLETIVNNTGNKLEMK